jgi:tetratricopeptide (TPR) repeat protein
VIAFGAPPGARSAAARLVELVRTTGGLVLTADAGATPLERRAAEDGAWRALPADVVRVLRTAAALGDEVDARRVAAAIGEAPVAVLERLQAAVDRGVAIEDHGDMRFALPPALAATLRGATLPSLSRALRERDAAGARPPAPHDAAPKHDPPAQHAPPTHADPPTHDAPPKRAPSAPPPTARDPARPAAAPPPPAEAKRRAPDPPSTPPPPPPDLDEGEISRWLDVAREAEALGAHGEAVAAAGRALALLDLPPETDARRRRRAEVLCQIGRLEWLGAGPEHDFSLAGALDVLRAAQASLRADDPVALRALASRLIADVCYDLGDGASLDRALAELTRAAQELHAAGEPYEAARLLDDQAAIYVRMGDPVRAAHLLEQSRRVFEERADRDPIALAEVAETDHLLARIPLHVPPRPGKELEALEAAMRHARRAEGAWKRLGRTRELGRVWETMGRLELAGGDPRAAVDRLRAAASAQHASGDAIGLARTTAAMADTLEAASRHREALGLLSDSVRYNLAKGSPLGLAYNRRAFEAIAARVTARGDAVELARVEAEIEAAEAVLGRIGLPGETG